MQASPSVPEAWTRNPTWQYSNPTPQPLAPSAQTLTDIRPLNDSSYPNDTAERSGLHKRRACNECRQQKLRCELANIEDPASTATCSRCSKLGLDCRIDESFKRTRKRRRSVDFEQEIANLKQQLSQYERLTGDKPNTIPQTTVILDDTITNDGFATTIPNGISPISPDNTVPGATTRPHEHEVHPRPDSATPRSVPVSVQPRSLGNLTVSVDEANELFRVYFTYYHPFLPVLDPSQSSQTCYETFPLLFWAIIGVAARRHTNVTLLASLAETVPDLMWKTIRSVPHSLSMIESLLLLVAWPFPTSSSATDPSYMLSGIAVHASLQLGLHRPMHQQDFTKYRVNLNQDQVAHRLAIWTACNIIAQSVSIGVGLGAPAHLHDWASVFASSSKSSPHLPEPLRQMLQVERFRNEVIEAIAMNATDENMVRPIKERLAIYRLFENNLAKLEADLGPVNGKYLYAQIN